MLINIGEMTAAARSPEHAQLLLIKFISIWSHNLKFE